MFDKARESGDMSKLIRIEGKKEKLSERQESVKDFSGQEWLTEFKEKRNPFGDEGFFAGRKKGADRFKKILPLAKKTFSMITGLGPMIILWKSREKIKTFFATTMLKKVVPNLIFVLGKVKMAMMYFLMGLMAIFVIVTLVKQYSKTFGKINDWFGKFNEGFLDLRVRFSSLWDNIKMFFGGLWKIVVGAFTGDFDKVMDGVLQTVEGLFWGGLDLIVITATTLLYGVIAMFYAFWDWVRGPENMEKFARAATKVLTLFGIWMMTRWLVASAIAYAAAIWGGWLVAAGMLVVIIAAALVGWKDEIIKYLINIWTELKDTVGQKGGGILAGAATGALAGAYFGPVGAIVGGIIGAGVGFAAAEEGGIVNSNQITLVGEKGPELAKLPQGTRIHDAKQTQKMLGAASNKVNNNTINVHVNGRLGASDAELRNIAKKVGSMINNEINRSTSTIGGI